MLVINCFKWRSCWWGSSVSIFCRHQERSNTFSKNRRATKLQFCWLCSPKHNYTFLKNLSFSQGFSIHKQMIIKYKTFTSRFPDFQVFLCPEPPPPAKPPRPVPPMDPLLKDINFSPAMGLFDFVSTPPVPQLDSPIVASTHHKPISSQVTFNIHPFNCPISNSNFRFADPCPLSKKTRRHHQPAVLQAKMLGWQWRVWTGICRLRPRARGRAVACFRRKALCASKERVHRLCNWIQSWSRRRTTKECRIDWPLLWAIVHWRACGLGPPVMVVLLVSLDGKPLGYGVSVANLDVSALLPHHLNYDSTGQFCESFLIPIGPKKRC